MSELLGGAKLPKMDTLKKQHRELSEKKKALYAEYRKAQADMRQAVAVKANIDHLLGHADEQKIRPRSVSSGPPIMGACAGTSGQSVQKFSGFGSSPTSIFAGPAPCKNFGVWPHPNCLPFRASPKMAQKTEVTLSFTFPPFLSMLSSLGL